MSSNLEKKLMSSIGDCVSQVITCPLSDIVLDKRYYLKSKRGKHEEYTMYLGVDTVEAKWVKIYSKPSSSFFSMSSKIKSDIQQTVCPKVLWSGDVQVNKASFFMEVHDSSGPSLKTVFQRVGTPNETQLIHLLLEMVKLVERISNGKMHDNVGSSPTSNLAFSPKRVHSEEKRPKYEKSLFKIFLKRSASRQAQGKLYAALSIKDDLQSICYILVDLYKGGTFMEDLKPHEYLDFKLKGNLLAMVNSVPSILVNFYQYISGLNHSDQINFYQWKSFITNKLPSNILSQPYGFIFVKEKSSLSNQLSESAEDMTILEDDEEETYSTEIDDDECDSEQQARISKLERSLNRSVPLR